MRRSVYIGTLILIGVLLADGSSGGESTGTLTAESATSCLTGAGQRTLRSSQNQPVVEIILKDYETKPERSKMTQAAISIHAK